MTTWEGILLGLIQGLTEFLPVSSSGHLAMARVLLGLDPDLPFEVFIHGATLVAIILFFRRRLAEFAAGRSPRYVGKLALSTMPAVIAAIGFRAWIDRAFESVELIAPTLAISGAALLSLYVLPRGAWRTGDAGTDPPDAGRKEPSWLAAWWIGCAQAISIVPGISRSGSTIVAGIWLGLTPAAAAEFSFLMGIPAIFGAIVLEAPEMRAAAFGGQAVTYLLGAAVAFVSGLAAIHLVFRLLARGELRWFGFYCWGVALAFAAFLWLR